jgi:hypothetical protein
LKWSPVGNLLCENTTVIAVFGISIITRGG